MRKTHSYKGPTFSIGCCSGEAGPGGARFGASGRFDFRARFDYRDRFDSRGRFGYRDRAASPGRLAAAYDCLGAAGAPVGKAVGEAAHGAGPSAV